MLQSYGIKLGLKELARFKFLPSFKHLFLPVNYWRNLEFKVVFDEANFKKTDIVLDIGSPKLLALYLSKAVGCRVYATDIENYFIKEYENLRDIEGIAPETLVLQTEDGRDLSFQDQFFDKVYAISVLEHIPEMGDLECIREVGRVLKKGGIGLITVPVASQSEIEYTTDNFYWSQSSVRRKDGDVFFQRKYSEQDLYERLIEPSGLKLRAKKYFGENILNNSKKEFSEYLPKIVGPIQPLLSKIFHTQGVDSWHELKKPLCALLILEKE